MKNKNDTKKITFIADIDLYNKISKLADKENRSVNRQVVQMVEFYFKYHNIESWLTTWHLKTVAHNAKSIITSVLLQNDRKHYAHKQKPCIARFTPVLQLM